MSILSKGNYWGASQSVLSATRSNPPGRSSTDIIFINKLPFIVSISRGIKSTTVEYISNRNKESLINSINKIVNNYKSRGLTVQMMYSDPEFEFLEGRIPCTNTAGARDHMPEVDQQIQVIKERMRAYHSALPFPHITKRMIIEMANMLVMLLNEFPPNIKLSKTYSPCTIMTGKNTARRAAGSPSVHTHKCTTTETS